MPVMRTWRALAAPLGQLHNLPQLCSLYCVATGREFQDLVHTRTNLPSRCLAAGRGVSLWAPGNGGVFASKRAWPASGVGAAASPSWCRLFAPNRSFRGSPGPGPGRRGGSSGDSPDMGFEQQPWPAPLAPHHYPEQLKPVAGGAPPAPSIQGCRDPCFPRGRAGILPGAWLGRPSASLAPTLLF